MTSQKPDVRAIASLARLDLDPAEVVEHELQFARVLAHFEALAREDVEGVEPMTGAVRASGVLRDDVPRASTPRDALLSNAPQPTDEFYAVPKTVGGDA